MNFETPCIIAHRLLTIVLREKDEKFEFPILESRISGKCALKIHGFLFFSSHIFLEWQIALMTIKSVLLGSVLIFGGLTMLDYVAGNRNRLTQPDCSFTILKSLPNSCCSYTDLSPVSETLQTFIGSISCRSKQTTEWSLLYLRVQTTAL